MPITLPENPSGAAIGPGFTVVIAHTVPMPPTNTTVIDVNLRFPSPSEEGILGWTYQLVTNPQSEALNVQDDGTWPAYAMPSRPAQGETIDLVVTIRDQSTVLETLRQPMKMDWIQGQTWQAARPQAVSGGGLTPTQDLMLQQINWSNIWGWLGHWAPQLWNLIDLFPKSDPYRLQITPDRIGEGSLERSLVLGQTLPVGIEWKLMAWPPGLGIDDTNPDVSEIDWGMLTRVRKLTQSELVADESHYEARIAGSWFWGTDTPQRIDYYILPGVTVRFWWLLMPFPFTASTTETPTP